MRINPVQSGTDNVGDEMGRRKPSSSVRDGSLQLVRLAVVLGWVALCATHYATMYVCGPCRKVLDVCMALPR